MPKQGGIQESMNRFLAQYLPMLFQAQQREKYIDYSQDAYLQRRLKEMAEMEKYDISATDRARVGNMLQNFFATLQAETQDLPYGSQQFAERSAPAAGAYGLKPIPVAPDLADKTQRYAKIGQELALAKVTGAQPSEELIEEAISLFGLDAVVDEVAKFNETAAKRIDQQHRAQELAIKGYEAETGRGTMMTAAQKEGRAGTEKQQDLWIDFIDRVEDHIKQEGVKLKDASKEDMREMFRVFSTAGRFPDPLSAETRSTVYSILGGIKTRLIDGKMPTEGEKRFIAEARSTYQIEEVPVEEGGGLIEPTKTQEELDIEEATIQAYMDEIRRATMNDPNPPDEATIRRLAMEYLRLIK